MTKPRIKMITALAECQTPVSIADLLQKIGDDSCDFVTLYRSLAILETAQIVRRNISFAGVALFSLADNSPSFYGFSKDGQAVERVDGDLAAKLTVELERIEAHLRELGFKQVSHVVQFSCINTPVPKIVPQDSFDEAAERIVKTVGKSAGLSERSKRAKQRVATFLRERFGNDPLRSLE